MSRLSCACEVLQLVLCVVKKIRGAERCGGVRCGVLVCCVVNDIKQQTKTPRFGLFNKLLRTGHIFADTFYFAYVFAFTTLLLHGGKDQTNTSNVFCLFGKLFPRTNKRIKMCGWEWMSKRTWKLMSK